MIHLCMMNILQKSVSALAVLITFFTLGLLGLLHVSQRATIPINPASNARPQSIATTPASKVQSNTEQQRTFPVADNVSASSTIPCDSDPNHGFCRKDFKHVYSEGYVIVGADPSTFIVLGADGNYGKDHNNVYWIVEGEEGPEPHAVLGADPKTFEALPKHEVYAKDAANVYWSGYTVDGADAATFSGVACSPDGCQVDARDREHAYLAGRIIETTSQ